MTKINILDKSIFNKIAAGEVVERPSSVIKELVENSIDSGANNISIEIKNGGIEEIKIIDNGCGIEKEDFHSAFLPHATSKLKEICDLEHIGTLGFRGEALSSISSVSKVTLISKIYSCDEGYSLKINGGEYCDIVPIGCANGTTIIVNDLFYNIPARLKFLKKPKSEETEITNIVLRLILSNPQIKFKYVCNNKTIYQTSGDNLKNCIYSIYGKNITDNLIELNYNQTDINISGYISKPIYSKANRTHQTLIINGRYVINNLISTAIQKAYEYFLMKGNFPMYVINVQIPKNTVDVNVHPSKLEVKFENSSTIFDVFYNLISDTLYNTIEIKDINNDNNIAKYKDKDSQIIDTNIPCINNLNNEINEIIIDCNDIKTINNPNKTGANILPNNGLNNNLNQPNSNHFNDNLEDNKKINNNNSFDSLSNFDNNNLEENKKVDNNKSFDNLSNIDDNNLFDNLSNILPNKEKLIKICDNKAEFNEKNDNNQYNSLIIDDKVLNEMDKLSYLSGNKSMVAQDNFLYNIAKSNINLEQDTFFKSENYKIIGSLFNTYLLVEQNNYLYIFDQHAAHERLLYEKYMLAYNNSNVVKQSLLSPEVMQLNNKEFEYILSNINLFNQLGFEFEDFGDNAIKINAVPVTLSSINITKFFNDILFDIENCLIITKSDLIREYIIKKACKFAVKGNDKLTEIEIKYLIEKVGNELDVLLCPHGRPIVTKLNKTEIEKWFKRIV